MTNLTGTPWWEDRKRFGRFVKRQTRHARRLAATSPAHRHWRAQFAARDRDGRAWQVAARRR